MTSVYSVNDLKQAAWLLYINGIEIPAISVNVSFGVWQVPSITFNLVPHPLLRRIGAEDRMQVAIFFLDQHWEYGTPQFRLLVEGEVNGFSYSNSPRGRQMTFTAAGHAKIFSELRFFYMSSVDDITQAQSPQGQTSPDTISTTKPMYPASLFLEGLTSDGGSVKRPIEFVLNVFRTLLAPVSESASTDGTVTVPPASVTAPGRNFYNRWLQMTGFHKRWAALPVLEDLDREGCFPLLKAVQDTSIMDQLRISVGDSVGFAGTAWELLQKIYSYMYMEVLALPTPPAVKVAEKTRLVKYPHKAVTQHQEQSGIATYYVKPACYFALPPLCNLVFPSMNAQWSYGEQYDVQPTRLYLNESYITGMLAAGTDGAARRLVESLMVTGYPEPVAQRMREATQVPTTANPKNMLLYPDEFFRGPNSIEAQSPPWLYLLSQSKGTDGKGVSDGVLGPLFDIYARYEFFRSRYAARSGSVSMAWNPYITPGFPGVIFDSAGTGFDIVAYITQVSHSFAAAGNQSTMASFSFARTLDEFATAQSDVVEVDARAQRQQEAGTLDAKTDASTKTWDKPAKSWCWIKKDKLATKLGDPSFSQDIFNQICGATASAAAKAKETINAEIASTSTSRRPPIPQDILEQARAISDIVSMDATLLPQVLHKVGVHFNKDIIVNRGMHYATPMYKDGKWRVGTSDHTKGNAVDFHIHGVSNRDVWLACWDMFPSSLGLGGYPNSKFTHIDVRAKRSRWIDLSGVGVKQSEDYKVHGLNVVQSAAEFHKKLVAGETIPRAEVWQGGPIAAKPQVERQDADEKDEDGTDVASGSSATAATVTLAVVPQLRDIYPAEVVQEIADTFQSLPTAQKMYHRLFYANADGVMKPSVFHWKNRMTVVGEDGATIKPTGNMFKFPPGSRLVPNETMAPFFASYDAAMSFVARPGCTLEEYIEIWHGKSLEAMLDAGQVAGEYRTFYSPVNDDKRVKGARFWGRIYRLVPGPGTDPGMGVTNYGPAPGYVPSSTVSYVGHWPDNNAANTAGFPQTRENWDERLLKYRRIIRGEEGLIYPLG